LIFLSGRRINTVINIKILLTRAEANVLEEIKPKHKRTKR